MPWERRSQFRCDTAVHTKGAKKFGLSPLIMPVSRNRDQNGIQTPGWSPTADGIINLSIDNISLIRSGSTVGALCLNLQFPETNVVQCLLNMFQPIEQSDIRPHSPVPVRFVGIPRPDGGPIKTLAYVICCLLVQATQMGERI